MNEHAYDGGQDGATPKPMHGPTQKLALEIAGALQEEAYIIIDEIDEVAEIIYAMIPLTNREAIEEMYRIDKWLDTDRIIKRVEGSDGN